jgi:4-aminobutyrate aminotransferase
MSRDLSRSRDVVAREHEVYTAASKIPYFPLVVARGYGATIEDVDGNQYLDFLSSAASLNTGHAHPKIVAAVKAQAEKFLNYTMVYAYHQPAVELATRLTELAPVPKPMKVTFGLSGSDANDGAMKLLRRATGRPKIVAMLRSYHGSTYGAATLSAVSLNMTRGLGPMVPDVVHVPFADCYRCAYGQTYGQCRFDCVSYINMLFDCAVPADEVAGIILEPIQGDAGVVLPPPEFMQGLRDICSKHGILFVAEEVQTGFGRTGKWFAIEHWGIQPDVVVMGKALGAGMPISAVVARQDLMDAWELPAHLFTNGGNAVCCAAALANIEVIQEEKLVERSATLGEQITARFREMQARYELIGDVRGKGLMIGVDLVKDRVTKERARDEAAKICMRCYEKGLILSFFSNSVLRIAPPLVVSDAEVESALITIEDSIREVQEGRVPDEAIREMKGW